MKFILPRLFGLALIAGIGAIILSFVFKALIGITLLAALATLVWRATARRREYGTGQYGMLPAEPQKAHAADYGPYARNAMPVYAQKHPGIIPIY